jgi:hypothetical protein
MSKESPMKSAYELALERLESQGIEPPKSESLPEEVREEIAETRRKAEAELAELEILHNKRLQTIRDPGERQQEKDDYVLERRRIEEKRDRRIEKLRQGDAGSAEP